MQVINGDWAGAWESLKQIVLTVLNNLPAIIKGILSFAAQAALALGKGIVKAIWEGLKALPSLLVDAVKSILSGVWDLAKWVFQKGVELGEAIVRGILQGIKSLGGLVGNSVTNALGDVINQAKAKLQSQSPSKVFIEIGKSIPQGLRWGIESARGEVTGSVDKLLDDVIRHAEVRTGKNAAKQTIADARSAVLDALKRQAEVLAGLAGGASAVDTINKLLADPTVARIVTARTAALLRFNAALEDTLKLSRERTVGLPFEMRATGEETRERAFGVPMEMRSDSSATRERSIGIPYDQRDLDGLTRARRVLPDLVAQARERANQIADDLTQIIGGAFENLLDRGWRGFLSGMLDSAKHIFSQIADEFISQLLRGALGGTQQGKAGGIVGWLTGAIFGALGGGLAKSSSSPLGGPGPGGILHEAGHFADGGWAQGWSMVGERGPELAYFGGTGAQIYSNQDSKRMAGGTTVQHIFNMHFQSQAPNSHFPRRSESEFAGNLMSFIQRRFR
jgi:hypothetical protein